MNVEKSLVMTPGERTINHHKTEAHRPKSPNLGTTPLLSTQGEVEGKGEKKKERRRRKAVCGGTRNTNEERRDWSSLLSVTVIHITDEGAQRRKFVWAFIFSS